MSQSQAGAYAGDVSVTEAWEGLKAYPEATLIDVRTEAEWAYVGLPSLAELEKELVLVAWHTFATVPDPDSFAAALAERLEAAGIGKDAPLYFICRSGSRSRSAAIAMTSAGFVRCFNVAAGFEGPLDPEGHRGRLAGWKAEGLPWQQS